MRHKMDMDPEEIKIALMRAKVTQAEIARKFDVTGAAVTRVISGDSTSRRIREAIAEAINTDIRWIWPSTYVVLGGPRKPGRPKSRQADVRAAA